MKDLIQTGRHKIYAMAPWLRYALCFLLPLTGCLLDPAPLSDVPADPTGAWHEAIFERALILESGGQAVCAGTRCRQIDDTLGTGTWDTIGSTLTLTAVSGQLWWPGGSGLSPGSSQTFEFEVSGTDLVLMPGTGAAIPYTKIDPISAVGCSTEASLRLLFPRGGEVFTKGDTIRIRWRAGAMISSVQVDLSTDSGKTYWNICGRAISTGVKTHLDWAVEAFDDPANECYLDVFDYANHNLGSSNSGAFVIKTVQ